MTTFPTTSRFQTSAHRRLCYDTTRWQRFLFDERASSGAVFGAKQSVALASGKATRESGKAGPTEDAHDLGAEVFARLYDDPAKLAEGGEPGWVRAAHEILEGLPEFGALRENVAGDPDLAALATAECLQAIAPKVAELAKAAKDQDREQAKSGKGAPLGASTSAEAAAVRSALRKAIGKATQRVGDAREALEGLAPGLGSAPPSHEQGDKGRLTLAETLLQNPKLREILRRAGRISRLSRDRRKVREVHARHEVVDIERGADLGRMLPAALARLRHPLLRKLALRDIIERQALQYRLEGKEPMGRGPIVVLLDRSGSMQGDPEQWAAATAIALVGAGVREKRPVTVVEFTCDVDTAVKVVRERGQGLSTSDPSVAVGASQSVAEVSIGLATRRSSGGTEFGPVLQYGMRCGALDDRADLVFVTDGLATADDETLGKLAEAKRRGLRVWALTVNGGSLSPSIAAIADAAVDLDGVEDIAEAIASAMPE